MLFFNNAIASILSSYGALLEQKGGCICTKYYFNCTASVPLLQMPIEYIGLGFKLLQLQTNMLDALQLVLNHVMSNNSSVGYLTGCYSLSEAACIWSCIL